MTTLNEIAHLLLERYGLASTPEFLHSLQRVLNQRSLHAGQTKVEDYGVILKNSPTELRHLVEDLVIGETFFFRYPESFSALKDWVGRTARRPLRILSLACSTGEEPYSIAMSLLDAGLSKEEFYLEGRDVSTTALVKAREGVFTANSFRGMEGDWRKRYFQPRENEWQIRRKLREIVQFHEGNLLDLTEQKAWDVIFCRNVLIYFSAAQQRSVARRLKEALHDDGLLFLGSSEPVPLLDQGWGLAPYSMAFACVKGRELKMPRRTAPSPLRSRSPLPKPSSKIREVPARSLPPPVLKRSELEQAETLADTGQLEEALRTLRALLKQEPENSAAHFLMGVVEEARGEAKAAESSYRKVLFLDPLHREALMHMALLLQSQGRHQAAEQMTRRAAQKAITP